MKALAEMDGEEADTQGREDEYEDLRKAQCRHRAGIVVASAMALSCFILALVSFAQQRPRHHNNFFSRGLDLSDPADSMQAWLKTRLSFEDNSVTWFWFSGEIFEQRDGSKGKKLFHFEGFNAARYVEVEGGYEVISREMGVYRDKDSGAILEQWESPEAGKVDVIHVWNDPVNWKTNLSRSIEYGGTEYTQMGDRVSFPMRIWMDKESDLSVAEYPMNAQHDRYQASEMFEFWVDKRDLEDPSPSAPATVSWTRIGPWLPWMCYGQQQGHLVYSTSGFKLRSYREIPAELREYVERHDRTYMDAPTHYETPNQSSFKYFAQLYRQRKEAADVLFEQLRAAGLEEGVVGLVEQAVERYGLGRMLEEGLYREVKQALGLAEDEGSEAEELGSGSAVVDATAVRAAVSAYEAVPKNVLRREEK